MPNDATTDLDTDVDVLVVGAGISGVAAAYHLRTQCPDRSFVVLENQESFGGTWRTHTYPGIRSDSDLFTFGYRFKPWTGTPIATADKILEYMGEVIDENDLDQFIRYNHTISNAAWSSADKRWTVQASVAGSDEPVEVRARFLWMCQGYYRHSEGYTPTWPGMDSYEGDIVHPQTWPDDLDYANKRVVVIGSGATAATIVPAMAGDAAHVTMLQRSPTYFATGRNSNELAEMLRELEIPVEWTHEIVRRKVIFDGAQVAKMSRLEPETVKAELHQGITDILGDDYPLDPHFTPTYRPWHQRIAFVPDGDLFHAINDGNASVATDEIETFVEKGILLKSGETLEADIVVTATGFNLNVLGDIAFEIDNEPMDFAQTVTWRGAMFSGVPNMTWVFGYFRASWTLRADLIADLVCRLLNHMDTKGVDVVTPTLGDDAGMELKPWVEAEDFNPGYIRRGIHLLPKQGDRDPWIHTQNYVEDKETLPAADLDDGSLHYS